MECHKLLLASNKLIKFAHFVRPTRITRCALLAAYASVGVRREQFAAHSTWRWGETFSLFVRHGANPTQREVMWLAPPTNTHNTDRQRASAFWVRIARARCGRKSVSVRRKDIQ